MVLLDFINLNCMQSNILYVLTSARNVRDFYLLKAQKNGLIPKAISIAEFESKAILVKGFRRASNIEQLLIMQKAAKCLKSVSDKLGIPTEFFAFLKNSDYLFSFFKELKNELVPIKDLKQSDIYANYEEHLTILEELEKIYIKSLKEAFLYDDITICELYEINLDFISSYNQIYIKIDGILSKFKWKILTEISSKIEVILEFSSSKFNQKMILDLSKITDLNYNIGMDYIINFSKKFIISSHKISTSQVVKIKGFSMRSLQCAYVFDEISNFIRAGIDSKNIAVILPDEGFYPVLQNCDDNHMLNFSMGSSFKNEAIFILLSTLKASLNDGIDYVYSKDYLLKSKNLQEKISILNFFKFDTNLYAQLKKIYKKQCDFDSFKDLIIKLTLELYLEDEVSYILENELFLLNELLKEQEFSFEMVFELLLLNLSKQRLNLVGGGEVVVTGILESRSKNYEAVIIVDFNDNFIPHRSQKEMFLSSKVRKNSGLISHQDRENLQRFYYENVIRRAKFVSISYLDDKESSISRFGRDFNFIYDNKFSEEAYLNALNQKSIILNLSQKVVKLKHNFFEYPLSFSRLNTYLDCKMKYYYRYILGIKEYRNFLNLMQTNEFGIVLHEFLNEYFSSFKSKFYMDKFLELFKKYENRLAVLDIELFKTGLDEFSKSQNEYFEQGNMVFECEKKMESEIYGIRIQGIVDRIDISKDGNYSLIDYKSGLINEKSFQLSFYEALCQKDLGECKSYYLNILKDYILIENKITKDSLEELIENLKREFDNEVIFDRNLKSCEYCSYALFCKKELK